MLNVKKRFGGWMMSEPEFANILRLLLAFVVLSAFARVVWEFLKGFVDGYFDARNGKPFDKGNEENKE